MSSNVPRASFSSEGLSIPAESAIKAGVWADLQAAFGGALNQSDATPQGQIATSLTAMLGAGNDLLLQYVNLIDPAFASGRMQDAIARIYYLTRIPARATIVTANCTGADGTLIPAGALAQASDGTIYQCLSSVTIPSTGTVSVTFQAITTGPITCPAGTLNAIYRVVPGWDSITNPADGVIGRHAETPAEFEQRRADSVAHNAAGILPAVRGAVLGVNGVVDAFVTENNLSAPLEIGDVEIDPNSLYVAVYGGADADVAQAIWSKKQPGCGYSGNTTVSVTDRASGYSLPYPTYSVKFQRATALPIHIAIQVADNGLVPADAVSLIRNAVVNAFNGGDGQPRARIGGKLYALRFAAPVQSVGAWSQVVSIAIGTSSSPSASEIDIPIDRMPTIAASNIAVTLT